jgi:hypothetical protein
MVENQWRDIARIGIAVAHEASSLGGFLDGGFEHPEVLFGAAEREFGLSQTPPAKRVA